MEISEFYKNKSKADGLACECKECSAKKGFNYYKNNKEVEKQRRKDWYEKNKEQVKKRVREYHHTNKDRINEYRRNDEDYKKRKKEVRKIWYQRNREKVLQQAKIARQKDKYKQKRNARFRQRRKEDPKFRLDCNFSSQICDALQGRKAGHSWQSQVGYSLKELTEHLECQFDSNMTWENYGSYWHVDHIIPRSHFKYQSSKDREFLRCWSLENLRPLEAKENIRKGNRCVV